MILSYQNKEWQSSNIVDLPIVTCDNKKVYDKIMGINSKVAERTEEQILSQEIFVSGISICHEEKPNIDLYWEYGDTDTSLHMYNKLTHNYVIVTFDYRDVDDTDYIHIHLEYGRDSQNGIGSLHLDEYYKCHYSKLIPHSLEWVNLLNQINLKCNRYINHSI